MNFSQYTNLVIYGTGKCAEACMQSLNLSIDKVQIVSSFKNEMLLGKNAIALHDLNPNISYTFIIASQYVSEIYQLIEQSELQIEQIYSFLFESKKVVSVSEFLRLKKRDSTLYAFYDLELNAASFDACVFANAAEEQRICMGLENICFVIVPPITKVGKSDWFNHFYQNGDVRAFQERINYLLIPVFQLIKSCIACVQLVERNEVDKFQREFNVFPLDFDVATPTPVNIPTKVFEKNKPIGHFSAPQRAITYVDQRFEKLGSKIMLTFTIREYTDQPFRNNDIDELKKFLPTLDLDVFFPVIVRDTSSAGLGPLKGLEDYCHIPEAALDIGIRCALYEKSDLNFFVNNGVACIACFNPNISCVVFKMSSEFMESMSLAYYRRVHALEHGDEQFFWASNDFQKLCWQHDSCENIALYLAKYMKSKSLKEN